MKKRYIWTFLMILCCAFLFCGCASVSYTVVEREDGGVDQIVEIDLDEIQLRSAGASAEQIVTMKTDIKVLMQNKQASLMTEYLTKVNNDKSLNSSQKQMLVEGVETKVEVADSMISAHFEFANVAVYYYFYDIDPTEDDGEEQISQESEGLFYNKYIQTTKTIFSNQELINSYVNFANEYIDSLSLSNPTKIKAPQYSYSYKTSNMRLKSDADQVSKTEDGVVHTWFMMSDQAQREIHFYTRQPRRELWYAFALGGAVLLVGVLFVVNIFKSKKEKKDEVEIVEP